MAGSAQETFNVHHWIIYHVRKTRGPKNQNKPERSQQNHGSVYQVLDSFSSDIVYFVLDFDWAFGLCIMHPVQQKLVMEKK